MHHSLSLLGEIYDIPLFLGIFVAFFLGTIFGSFVTLASHRIPRGEDIIYKPSRCPICLANLRAGDLIPIFSWIFKLAKCSYCKTRISIDYPLIEIAQGLMFSLAYYAYGPSMEWVITSLISVCLLIIIVIDLRHQIIPDKMQIALLLLAIPYIYVFEQDLIQAITGGAVGFITGYFLYKFMLWWKKQEGLGFGDVKFLGVVGIYLNLELFVLFLLLSGVLGLIQALIWKILGKGKIFPFAPSLCISMLACILFPEKIRLLLDIGERMFANFVYF